MRNLMALVFGIAGAVLGLVFVNPVLASMLMGRLFSDPQSVATGHLLIFWGTAAVGAIVGWLIGRKIGGWIGGS
jgi:hypothetical protein